MFWNEILMKLGRLTNLPEWLLRNGFPPFPSQARLDADVGARLMFWNAILMKLGRLTNLPEWLLRNGFPPFLSQARLDADVGARLMFWTLMSEQD